MLAGIIDRIRKTNQKYVIGGWAYHEKDDVRNQVTFQTSSPSEIQFVRIERTDSRYSAEIGFESEISLHTLTLLLLGTIQIEATYDTDRITLDFWKKCREKANWFIIGDWLFPDVSPETVEQYCRKSVENLLSQSTGGIDSVCEGTVISTGSKSIFEDVIVGTDGYLFLFKGSNRIHDQYLIEPPPQLVDSWVKRIEMRQEICKNKNVKFLQLVIPEKQSICNDRFPIRIEKNTRLYQKIVKRISANEYFLDADACLRDAYSNGESVYRKIDTHFSLGGVTAVMKLCLEKLGFSMTINRDKITETYRRGDLGQKFFRDGEFVEKVAIPDYNYIVGASDDVSELKAVDVQRHIGNERSWRNEIAPFDLKILIFGNSFFERGADPLCLSYWFCRLFKNVYFLWLPEMKPELIDQYEPDVVFCQTNERFLPAVPGL